ncbi:ABC transporter permease [Cryobacterium sp. PH31-O1]|uniref:ABC transporter permease n=1 Tax=Cryobacterium sp. PH31-O1 TaxID=3046306 RepID=UPI0024B8E06A|nr:ABC transporter permease [Cryobacterium sp. PH31-O1]MDJ0337583.1 ABC transporter permease [Cryobacterium sp. PH31-O1]
MSSASAEERSLRIAQEPLLPVGQSTGFITGTWSSIKEVLAHRELLGLLVRREIKARYKDSSLGLVWSLAKPLAQLLVYYFAIGQILGVARSIPSFAIFVFVGLIVWGLFTEIVSSGTMSIVNNAGLVKKVYLPREIFPLAAVGGGLFNFGVQLIILIAATIIGGQVPLTPDLALAPLALINVIIFASAMGMLLAAVTVYLRDLQHLIEVVLTVLFWASPVVYSFSFVHAAIAGTWLEQLYLANPVTLSVLGMQKALWLAGSTESNQVNFPPDLALRLWISLFISIALLWIAQRIFSRLQGNFAQEL